MADNVEFGMDMNFGDSFKNLAELKKRIGEIESALKKANDPKVMEGLSNALTKLNKELLTFKNDMISTITIMKNADKQVFSNIGKGLKAGFDLSIQSVNAMNSATKNLVNTLKQAQGAAAMTQVNSAYTQANPTGSQQAHTQAQAAQANPMFGVPNIPPVSGQTITSYKELLDYSKQLDMNVNSIRLSMLEMEKAGNINSSDYKNLNEQLKTMAPQAADVRGRLRDVQMATAQGTTEFVKYNKATGVGSKNTQNFVYETNSMQQVLRELPSFAYGAQTGLMALSNNLPILADNFKQMAGTIDNTTGKAVGFKGALLEMVKSIGSPMGLISLGITALTAFGPAIYNYIAGVDDAKKAEKKAEEQKKRLLELDKQRLAQLKANASIMTGEILNVISLGKQIQMSNPYSKRRNELIEEYNKISYIKIKNTKDELKFQSELAYAEKKNAEWITHRIGIKLNESYLEKLMTEQYVTNAKIKGMADRKAWYDAKVDREEQLRIEINAAEKKGKFSDAEWKALNKLKQERWALNEIVNREDLLKMSSDYDKLTASTEKNGKEQKRTLGVIGQLSRLIPAFEDDKVKKSKKAAQDKINIDKDYYGKEGDIEKMLIEDLQNLETIRLKIHQDTLEKEILQIENQYDALLIKANERYNTETDMLYKIYSAKVDVINMEKEYQAQIDITKDKVKKQTLIDELKGKKNAGFQTFLIDDPQAIRSLDLLTRTITNLQKQMQKDMTDAARKSALERYNNEKNLNRKLNLDKLLEDKKTKEIEKQLEENFFNEIRDINETRSKSYKEKPKQVIGESGEKYKLSQLEDIKKKRDALIETNPTANLVGEYELAIKQLSGVTKDMKDQFEEYDESLTKYLEKRAKADKEYTLQKAKLSDSQRQSLKDNNQILKTAEQYFTQTKKEIDQEQERLLLKKEELSLSKEEHRDIIDKSTERMNENEKSFKSYEKLSKEYDKLPWNTAKMFLPNVMSRKSEIESEMAATKAGRDLYMKNELYVKNSKEYINSINDDLAKTDAAITKNAQKELDNNEKIAQAKSKIAATNKVLSTSEQILAKKPAQIEKEFQDSIKTLGEDFKIFMDIRDKIKSENPDLTKFELDKKAFEELIKKMNEDPKSAITVEVIPQITGKSISSAKFQLTDSEIKDFYAKMKEEFTQKSTALALEVDVNLGKIVDKNVGEYKQTEKESGRVKFKKAEQFKIDGVNREIAKAELEHEKELLIIKKNTIGVTEEELWAFHQKEMQFWRDDRKYRVQVSKDIANSILGVAQSTLDVLSAMTNNSMNLMNERMALQEQMSQNTLDNYDREIAKIQNVMDTQSMSDEQRINSTQKIMDLQNEKALQEKNQKVAQLELQKKQIEITKKMALAQAAISGGIALANVVAIATEGALGTGPAAPFVFAAELASGIAAVGTQVYAAKTAIESADLQTQTIDAQISGIENSYQAGIIKAGSAISSSTSYGANAPLTTFNASLVNQGQSNANYNLDGGLNGYKIYVTQADIQSANNQVTKITKKVTFG
ncbi:hypothetical protein UFOVP182_9 [uncultured Caudovirales phage]|uniref:Uncharacterized protein n=1 Tax=uncultured Caudovirales phage TaxID=2100421 RepID=A0A6J7WGB6_9CAUD|nr:hypothetical protein UFOVP182_9 [uncultured Caudovirales phage]